MSIYLKINKAPAEFSVVRNSLSIPDRYLIAKNKCEWTVKNVYINIMYI